MATLSEKKRNDLDRYLISIKIILVFNNSDKDKAKNMLPANTKPHQTKLVLYPKNLNFIFIPKSIVENNSIEIRQVIHD